MYFLCYDTHKKTPTKNERAYEKLQQRTNNLNLNLT